MKKIINWLNNEHRYSVVIPIFVASFSLFSATVIPLLVTVDGIIYIANAKSLFTEDFPSLYTLYREPGYPLFIKTIHFFGDAGLLIVIAQSALLASAGIIGFHSITRLFGLSRIRMWEILLLGLMLANPMFLVYSGAVLQQALFTFQLAGFSLMLSFSIHKPRKLNRLWISILTLVWYLLCISTSIGWLYLGLLPVAAGLYLLFLNGFWAQRNVASWLNKLIAILAIPILLAITYGFGRITFQQWENFKAQYISSSADDGYVIKPLSSVPYIPTPAEMTNRTLSLMNMTVIEPYEKENDLFMGIQMRRQSPSSNWDTAFKSEPQASYAATYVAITNPSELLHNGYARLASIAPLWYQISFIAMWLLTALLLVMRKFGATAILILVPINFLLVYAASNSPIDRYGIPAYSFAAVSVVILLGFISNKLKFKSASQ